MCFRATGAPGKPCPEESRHRECIPVRGGRARRAPLDRVAHAEERLQLVGALGQARILSARGDRVGKAAHIVAAEGGSQGFVVLQKVPGASLEAGVALPFLKVDGLGPAQAPCGCDFIIPVCTLHQADRDRCAAALDPFAQHLQLGLGVGMVSLDHDTNVEASREIRAPRARDRKGRS